MSGLFSAPKMPAAPGPDPELLRRQREQEERLEAQERQSAEEIARNVPKSVQVHFAADMKAAVQLANSSAESGQQVLLSPACASFDQFANYVDRGERFEQAVRELAA